MSDNACHSELNYVQMICNGLFIQMFSSLRPNVCQGFHVDWYLIEFLIIRLGNSSHVKFNGSFISETQTLHPLMCMWDSWGLPGSPLGLWWSSRNQGTPEIPGICCVYISINLLEEAGVLHYKWQQMNPLTIFHVQERGLRPCMCPQKAGGESSGHPLFYRGGGMDWDE